MTTSMKPIMDNVQELAELSQSSTGRRSSFCVLTTILYGSNGNASYGRLL